MHEKVTIKFHSVWRTPGLALYRHGVMSINFINKVELMCLQWWFLYLCNFHFFLPNFLTIPLHGQCAACALGGLTLPRQSFFEDTIYPDGQFPRSIILIARIRMGNLDM